MTRAIVFDLFHTLIAAEDFRPRNYSRVTTIAAPTAVRHTDVVARCAAGLDRGVSPEERADIDGIIGGYDDMAMRRPRTEGT